MNGYTLGARSPGPIESSEECFVEARRRIASAIEASQINLSFNDLTNLRALPEELIDAQSLKNLSLSQTQVSDLTPVGLLMQLETVGLQNCPIPDLSPLATLTELRQVYAGGTLVTDLSALKNLRKLNYLTLEGTNVSDLGPLSGLKRLANLQLAETNVSDLEPLRQFTWLSDLGLRDTCITDLDVVRDMSLGALDLSDTSGINLAPLVDCTNLSRLYLYRVKDLEIDALAHMTWLADAAVRSVHIKHGNNGLHFDKSLSPDPFIADVCWRDAQIRTVEAINHLRLLQGFEPHIPDGYPVAREYPWAGSVPPS